MYEEYKQAKSEPQPHKCDTHFIVRDMYNGEQWRFELYELNAMKSFLLSDERPVTTRVYMVGAVVNVTEDIWRGIQE